MACGLKVCSCHPLSRMFPLQSHPPPLQSCMQLTMKTDETVPVLSLNVDTGDGKALDIFPAGFFPGGLGGFPQAGKILPIPQPIPVPAFWPEPVPPNWVLSPKISKILPHFSLNFDYFSAQNCIRKLYFVLKTKFALILLWGGIFGSANNFSKSPPSDSVADGDQKSSPQSKPPRPKFCL